MLDKAVRRHQLLSLEEAVHLLTDVQAQLYGLRERGRVAEGWYADLVVIDPATVASEEVAMRFDLRRGRGGCSPARTASTTCWSTGRRSSPTGR